MRRVWMGLIVAVGLALCPASSQAQVTQSGGDPFSLYYGFYLPRQQALLNQPGPTAQLNTMAIERKYQAQVDRSELYDPSVEPFYLDMGGDPARFGSRTGQERKVRTAPMGVVSTVRAGHGDPRFFNRIGSYYPSFRTGGGARAGGQNIYRPRPISAPMGFGGMGFGS